MPKLSALCQVLSLAVAVGCMPTTMAAGDPAPSSEAPMGQLAVAQNADGRLELFKTDVEGALMHRWQKVPNGEWSGWSSLGGTLEPGLSVATNSNGLLEVFGVDRASHALLCIRQSAVNEHPSWGKWLDLGGNIRPPVAVGHNMDGQLELFAVDAVTGSAKYIWQINGMDGWSGWHDLGGSLSPGLMVERNRDGCMELFGVDIRNHNLVHCWQNGANSPGSWSDWDSLGGNIQPGFAIGRNVDGRLAIFALSGYSHEMEHLSQIIQTNGVRWTDWTPFGGDLRSGITIGQNADGRLEVFAVNGKHNDVMHRWQLHPGSDNWSAWWSLWGSVRPSLAVGRNQDGNLEIFGMDSINRAKTQHKRQISANLDWLDWFSMDQPVFPYTSQTWQTEDGLPHNVVRSITQTPDGYLWVGTPSGLARFDGVRFTTFDARNTSAFKSSSISSLRVDHQGTLWIGTEMGLASLRNGAFTEVPRFAGEAITVLTESRDGSLWIGTSKGLNRYKDGHLERFTKDQGLLSDVILAVFEDAQTNLWVGTDAGLNRLSGSKMESFSHIHGLPNAPIRGITQDKGWRIWIGSDNGMVWYNTGQFYAYDRRYGLSDSFVSAVCEDHDGNLWVGTHSGLNRFREGRFFNELKSEGAPYDKVNAFFEDREGNLWVGSIEGLIRLTPRRFITYNNQQGLSHNNTVSVLEDRNGSLWVGTYGGGLNCLRDEQVLASAKSNGLPQDLILALGESSDGSLWIGTGGGGGLYQMKNGSFKHYTSRDGLLDAPIQVIHEDRSQRLWLGTTRGLVCFSEGKFRNYRINEHSTGENVLALCEDQSDRLWIGTETGLSCRDESGKFTTFTVADGLSANAVTALYEDAEKNLWIGTADGGLNRHREGTFHSYSSRQGLFNDTILEILEDDYGWLWMSCPKGIFRVPKKEFDDLDQGKIKAVTSIAYGRSDGMAGTLCNGVAKPAGWKARDGRLWFTTTKGLVVVDPNIRVSEVPPPVCIEEVLADKKLISNPVGGWPNGDVPPSQPLALPAGRGELEFHFTALDLKRPDGNRFKYMLEGVDSSWNSGTRRVAHYNNIYPGRYTFRVQAINSDGVSNEKGASLTIIVQPHLWETWWFRALAVLVILGAVGGAARYATQLRMQRKLELLKQQHAIERERGRIAKDIHDDLGSSLTRIMMLGERTREDIGRPEELESHSRKIVTSARNAVQALDEIVWAVNPENDTLDGLVGYLNQYASQFFEGTSVRCRLEIAGPLPSLAFPAEVRHDLFLVVKEALNNVLKHSKATEARICITEKAGLVEIIVEDNGTGFANAINNARRGNGLLNMRKRMKSLHGDFEIHSGPGRGTKVKFTARVKLHGAQA